MHQNNFNKDLKMDSSQRQRPLQKSMLLPDTLTHSMSPNARVNPLQFSAYTPMKKSFVNAQQNQSNYTPANNYTPNLFPFSQGTLNLQQNTPSSSTFESRISMQTEPTHQSYTIKGLVSPHKIDQKSEQSPEDYPRLFGKNQKNSYSINEAKTSPTSNYSNESLVLQIVNQLKERHLPTILFKLKKQIYDDIHNIRLEFQSLREEMRSNIKKQDGLINQIRFCPETITTSNVNIMPKQKHQKHDQLAELQTHYFLLEGKLAQIDAKLSQNSKGVLQQIDKLNSRLDSQQKGIQMRPSIIKSSLSSIMLEYRESFAIKRSPNIVKAKEEQQLIFNSCIYFIDRSGYLMDQNSHYLIDNIGNQIRLQEKHLKILESHKILEK